MGRKANSLYRPGAAEPFRLSRSKIELFLECPCCFYLDRRLGVSRPSLPGFSLNAAVDFLLKREFDLSRRERRPHPLMEKYGVEAIPFQHPDLEIWRDNFLGKEHHHPPTNLLVCGAVDDLWEDPQGELMVVDYKATSTSREITLEDPYKQSYKKQLEIYQWLFRQEGFRVSPLGYFVFANAKRDRPNFGGKLEFELTLVPHRGETDWIEPVLEEAKKCLESDQVPPPGGKCEYCLWRRAVQGKEAKAGEGKGWAAAGPLFAGG